MRALVCFLLLIATSEALAGSKIIGNGGGVFSCDDGKTVYLIDLWEAGSEDLNLKVIDPLGQTYQQKLEFIRLRISARYPRLAELLKQEISDFEIHNRKAEKFTLVNTEDYYNTTQPTGCVIAQIANQKPAEYLRSTRQAWYLIDKQLWDKLSESHKAGLVLHEVLYRIGVRYGVEYSVGVRLLVGYFFSEEMVTPAITDWDWVYAFRETRLPFFEVGRIRIPLFEGGLRECEHVPGSPECLRVGQKFVPSEVAFYPDNSLMSIRYPGQAQTLEWASSNGLDFKLNTSVVTFLPRTKGMERVIQAKGGLSVALTSDPSTAAWFEVDGTFVPSTGTFAGTVRRSHSRQQDVGDEFQFSGNILELFNRR